MAERTMQFRWDEEGNAHIGHDDDLTYHESIEALGCLGCIVAHNTYINEGASGVADLLLRFGREVLAYLEFVQSGEKDESHVGVLPLTRPADNPPQEEPA